MCWIIPLAGLIYNGIIKQAEAPISIIVSHASDRLCFQGKRSTNLLRVCQSPNVLRDGLEFSHVHHPKAAHRNAFRDDVRNLESGRL